MTNEQFLIVTYVALGAGAAATGTVTWLLLRRPFREVTEALARRGPARLARRLLGPSLLAAALIGFASMSFTQEGCAPLTYDQVIANRAHIVWVEEARAHATLNNLSWTVLGWTAALTALLALRRDAESR